MSVTDEERGRWARYLATTEESLPGSSIFTGSGTKPGVLSEAEFFEQCRRMLMADYEAGSSRWRDFVEDTPVEPVRHTELERAVIAASAELMNAFCRLEDEEGVSHPSHERDVSDAVHDVQRVVAMRLARRVDPGAWGAGC